MSTARMRLGGLLTAGALTLTLAACAGDDKAATDTTTTNSAAAPADDGAAETSEAAPSTDTTAAAGEEVPVADFVAMLKKPSKETLSTYTMTMSMKSGGSDMKMEGAVDLSGDKPLADIDMTIPGAGAMKMIMADGRMFMSMPGVTEDGKFMEVPADSLGEAATAIEDIDVTSQFDDWEGAAQKIVFVGDDDVDGTTMRHYQVTMDASAIGGATGEDAGATSAPMEDVVYDLWIDDDNLMRKVAFEMEGMVTEVLTDNWGEPQDIKAPSKDQLMSGPTG